jgi:hypothetical protein
MNSSALSDPAALAAIAGAGELAASPGGIGQPVIVIPPRDPVGIRQKHRITLPLRPDGPRRPSAGPTRAIHLKIRRPGRFSRRCKIFTALAPALTYMSKTEACSASGRSASFGRMK